MTGILVASSAGREQDAAVRAGIAVTALVHVLLGVVLATATGTPDLDAVSFPVSRRLCGDVRCPDRPTLRKRRGPDEFLEDFGLIEAAVVPRLGLAEPRPGELPKLVKYEQPEKVEEAVNIRKSPTEKAPAPVMDVQPKKAEVDRHRKTLAAILGAPEDDDPRKRPTALERIVGSPDGSVHGAGLDAIHGNVYAGKVALAIRQQFTVPPFLGEAELKRLRMRIRVTRMNEAGQILAFEVVRESGNAAFDGAALRAIQRFVPKEGGTAYLPAPDATTLQIINRSGMVVDLDGALFR